MNYYSIQVTPPQYSAENLEILTAQLSDLPFDTFEETETCLRAFISEADWTEAVEKEMTKRAKKLGFSFDKTFIPYQNWNKLWEANFEPIQVDNFVNLRADFHPKMGDAVEFELTINPKMAFGTGHHATTYMMIQMMRDVDFENKKVLDYGCGTGILAILASKLRASTLEAVDIEYASFDNTIENCTINEVHNVKSIHGVLETIAATDFDVILANINRNVILDSLKTLHSKLNTEGVLLISGFLKEDEKVMLEAIELSGFKVLKTLERTNWLCMLLEK